MDFEEAVAHLAVKKGAEKDFPFGPEVLVFKVMGKMFALMGLDADPVSINLKCDPTRAEMLRELFPAVTPGYHMNKKHWITVTLDGSVPDEEVRAMMDDSYDLVVKGLGKADRERLKGRGKGGG
ncbi:MAG: MmcQ/YjbR family DNA-binding protein [Thermodesulfobacteriota bacterium]